MPTEVNVRRLPKTASLDGVRAVAVILTSLVHLLPHQVPGGIFGVDVFFVLSGFLITSLLLGELATRGWVDLKRFYVRRARRLLPAVVLLLVVFTAVVLLSSPTHRQVLVAAVVDAAVLTYTFNWSSAFGHDPPWQVDHLWSLSVEEQFYLLWPVLLAIIVRRVPRRTALVIVTTGALVSSVAQGVVFDETGSTAWAYATSPLHAQGILLGCLLAMLFTWRMADGLLRWLAGHSWAAIAAFLGILAAGFGAGIDDKRTYSGVMLAVCVASVVLIATLVAQQVGLGGGRLGRAFGQRSLAAIGRRSYSIYLWQNYVAWAMTPLRGGAWWLPANVAGTLLAAELSYRLVERRFIERRRLARSAAADAPPSAAGASTASIDTVT